MGPQKSDMAENVEMSNVSMLVPQHLMTQKLTGNVLVGLNIGGFLFEPPAAPQRTPEADLQAEAPKRGRPKKGTVRIHKDAKGKYGSRQCRAAEQEIRHLQNNLTLKPFQRWAVDILRDVVTKHNAELDDRLKEAGDPLPELRLSKNALAILQDATEAGLVVSGF